MYQYRALIIKWVDGDTVDVRLDLGFHILVDLRLRLRGIDTPERGEPGYSAAFSFAKDQAPESSIVTIRTYKTPRSDKDVRDKYHRYIADITLSDGCDLVTSMLSAGMGEPA